MVRLLYPSIRNPKSVRFKVQPASYKAGWNKCVSAYPRAGLVASQAGKSQGGTTSCANEMK